jgi:vacuolar-type H+-ATPase subunit H
MAVNQVNNNNELARQLRYQEMKKAEERRQEIIDEQKRAEEIKRERIRQQTKNKVSAVDIYA